MIQGNREIRHYVEGVHRFTFEAGYEVCRVECSSFYSRQVQNFCEGTKEVDFMLYHPGKRELWLIEVKDYRFDARPKVRELIDVLSRKVKDSLFLLRTAALCSPEEQALEGMPLREFARLSADAVTVRLAFLLELNTARLFPDGSMMANIKSLLLGEMRFIDENLVCAPITYPGRVGPWKTEPAQGEQSKRVESRMLKKEESRIWLEKSQNHSESRHSHSEHKGTESTPDMPVWKKRFHARLEGKNGNHSDHRRRR